MAAIIWLVGVYSYGDRAYGGPEEGGWWYNTSYRDEIFSFATEAEARACYDLRWDGLENGYVDIKSFDPLGTMPDPTFPSCHMYGNDEDDAPMVEQTVERLMPEYTPVMRPHYC